MICYILKTILDGFLTAVGAFLPVLLLMFIHYKVRSNSYKKERIPRTHQLIQLHKLSIKDIDKLLKDAFNQIGVKNLTELISEMDKPNTSIAKNLKLIEYLNSQLSRRNDIQEKVNRLTVEVNYLEQYSFTTYISNLLNSKYPEKPLK